MQNGFRRHDFELATAVKNTDTRIQNFPFVSVCYFPAISLLTSTGTGLSVTVLHAFAHGVKGIVQAIKTEETTCDPALYLTV